MKVENQSHAATKKILPLVDFVRRRCKYSALATLRILDAPPGLPAGGKAKKHADDIDPGLLDVAPSLIKLWVSRGRKFPYSTRHELVEEVGHVELKSWEEEFVFVLAHEAKHIDDFHALSISDPYELELRAEKFALKVLKAYRKANAS